MCGYVKLFRDLEKWEWYKDSNCKALFLHCLLKANFEDKRWQGVVVEKGSFITSLNHLSIETGMTVEAIRIAMNKLIKTGEISKNATNKFTKIIVNNWDKFQSDNYDNNKPTTNEQQTNNKRTTTTKEIKEIKERKEYIYIVEYLNKKAKKSFKYSTASTQRHINARLNEGFTVKDFEMVIDAKCKEWLGNPKMEQYLRPETLFGTKFESYLNQCRNREYSLDDKDYIAF